MSEISILKLLRERAHNQQNIYHSFQIAFHEEKIAMDCVFAVVVGRRRRVLRPTNNVVMVKLEI